MIGVRRMACEMHGCCFLANPVVANETTGAGLYTKEKECYQQPLTDYPEWFSLPFGTCSRDCHDANANFDKDDADATSFFSGKNWRATLGIMESKSLEAPRK